MRNRIALFDWDGTIRKGFTIKEWGKFLEHKYGNRGTPITKTIDILFSDYWDGKLSHDQLADKSAQVYARYIEGLPIKEVEHYASEFVEWDQDNLFSYSAKLLNLIRSLDIHPIIISGCPEVILRQYALIFNFKDLYGLSIKKEKGYYTEGIKVNPGISSEKKKVVNELNIPNKVDIAFGNSSSDLPLFKKSKLNVVVNNYDLKVPSHKISISEDPNVINILKPLIEKRV